MKQILGILKLFEKDLGLYWKGKGWWRFRISTNSKKKLGFEEEVKIWWLLMWVDENEGDKKIGKKKRWM